MHGPIYLYNFVIYVQAPKEWRELLRENNTIMSFSLSVVVIRLSTEQLPEGSYFNVYGTFILNVLGVMHFLKENIHFSYYSCPLKFPTFLATFRQYVEQILRSMAFNPK